jgi:hypothetical protein
LEESCRPRSPRLLGTKFANVRSGRSRALLGEACDGRITALDRRLTHTTKPEILGFVWLDFLAFSEFPVVAG